MADISAQLKVVFGTINELTLPVSGIGSAGMEACLASLPAPGEKAIVRPTHGPGIARREG